MIKQLIVTICFVIPFLLQAQDNDELYKQFNRYYEQGKTAKAESVMLKIADNNGKYFFSLFERAAVFMKAGELDSAYKYMDKATGYSLVNTMPGKEVYYIRRDTCFRWGLGILDQVILKCDTVAGYYTDRAYLRKELGLKREALSDYTLALKYDSLSYVSYYNRGLIYDELDILDSAVIDYTKSLKINPKNAATYLNRGFVLLQKGEFEKAVYDLERVPRYTNSQVDVAYSLNNLGYAYYKLHKLDLAEEKINQSIRILPSNSYAYRNLALISIEKGDIPAACKHLSKSVELGFTREFGNEVIELQEKHCTR